MVPSKCFALVFRFLFSLQKQDLKKKKKKKKKKKGKKDEDEEEKRPATMARKKSGFSFPP